MVQQVKRGRLPKNFTPPKKQVVEEIEVEATIEDEIQANIKKRVKVQAVEDTGNAELPTKIDLKHCGSKVRAIVPSHVFRCTSFKFWPSTWATEAESLNSMFVEPSTQKESLLTFLRNPRSKMIYGVAGNPDDLKAKYFAAYLVGEHIKALGAKSNVIWHTLYGGFDNPLMKEMSEPPTMIVICNLTPQSTNIKLEKARDILEKYPDIPRIVVIAGTDPMSFLTTKLFVPVHAVLYLADSLVRQKIQVI